MKKEAEIKIPTRINAPETTIYTQLVYKNEESLKTKPYVLMLPGGPGANHSHYIDYACMQEEANVIFYDPRGCGLSGRGDSATYTMDNNIEDIHFVINALGLEKVMVLGKSCGAMMALGFTVRYPEQVNALILAAGSPSYAFLETAKQNVLDKGSTEQKEVCETLWSGSFQNQEQTTHYFEVMETFYSWKKRHNEPANRPKSIHPYSFDALNEGFRSQVWQFDFTQDLPNINCPTLILVGAEDWITSPIYSKQLASGIPNSSLMVFDKSDHKMESDVPEQFFGAIREFIRNQLIAECEPLESTRMTI